MMFVFLLAACIMKFPGTSRGVIGGAINGKLMELRLRHKKTESCDGEPDENDDQS